MTEAVHTRHHARRRSSQDVLGYFKTAITAVLIVAVLACAGFVALSLSRGEWMVTPVLSGSMRPGFPVGGVVISQKTPLKEITVLDVIVFQNPIQRTEQMIHRIIKLTHEPDGAIKIETKGDNNPIRDPWTIEIRTRYVYRIRYSVPLIGYVAVAYQNHRGILVVVAGVLLLSVAIGSWWSVGSRKGRKRRDEAPASSEPAVDDEVRTMARLPDLQAIEAPGRWPVEVPPGGAPR